MTSPKRHPSAFSDVKSSDTYYETIQIAVKHGYINGMGNNRMDPEGTLTREQAATILGRLHKYAPTASASKLDVFTDKSKISSYATSYVAEAVSQGYINGYTDGTFKPQGNLRRGEIAKILYFYLGSSLGESGSTLTPPSTTTRRTSPSRRPARCLTRPSRAISTSQRACSPATST